MKFTKFANSKKVVAVRSGILAALLLLIHEVALAELGGHVNALSQDATQYGLEDKGATQTPHYSIHLLSADHLSLWQFADSSGNIFAVAWQGLNQPDLEKLLGKHFANFSSAVRERADGKRRHSHKTVSSTAIIEKWRLPHAARGVAYLPEALPEGVDPSALSAVFP